MNAGRAGSTFVGRRHERAAVAAAVDAALSGSGSTVLVTGEAGIGKTTLAQDAAQVATAAGARVLEGRCIPADGVPFDGIVGALATLEQRDLRHVPEPLWPDLWAVTPALVQHPGAPMPAAGQGRVNEAVAALLAGAAAEQGLVLIVEDAHWAPESTIAMLQHLSGRLARARVAIVVTVRHPDYSRPRSAGHLIEDWSRSPFVTRLELAGLGPEDAAALVRGSTGAEPSDDELARLLERTGGNPLYMRELLAAARSAPSAAGIPVGLRELFERTLDGLPDSVIDVLRVVAAAGPSASSRLAVEVTASAPHEVAAAVRQASAAGVLAAGGGADRLEFRHALLAETVLATAPEQDLRDIHAGIAVAMGLDPTLARTDMVAEMAIHWVEAGEASPAFEWSVRAAREAQQRRAPGAALAHLEHAVAALPDVDDVGRRAGVPAHAVLIEAAWAAELSGRNRAAVEFARQAATEARGAGEDPGPAVLELAEFLLRSTGEIVAAREVAEEALALIPDEPTPERIRALLASGWHWDLEPRRVRGLAAEAMALADAMGAPPLMAQARVQLGGAMVTLGEIDEGAALAREGRAIARDAGMSVPALTAHIPLAAMLIRAGRAAETLQIAREGLEMLRTGGETLFAPVFRAYELAGLFALGRWTEAADVATESSGDGVYGGLLPALSTRLSALQGDARAAADAADALLAVAADVGPAAAAPLAWASWVAGDADGAAAAVAPVLARAELCPPGVVNECVAAALLASRDARPDGGPGSDGGLVDALVEPEPGMVEARLWRAVARALDAERARPDPALWREALAVIDETDGWVHARVLALAGLARSAGPGDVADAAIEEAWKAAAALGSPALIGHVRAAAAQSESGVALGDEAAAVADLLTPRELEVLHLVAEGLTSRQAARRLAISEKTVSVHVSNTLRKLGVQSRTEAALLAQREGLIR